MCDCQAPSHWKASFQLAKIASAEHRILYRQGIEPDNAARLISIDDSILLDLVNTPIFSNFMGQLGGTRSASALFDTLSPLPGADFQISKQVVF
jgi:hypothetical protein